MRYIIYKNVAENEFNDIKLHLNFIEQASTQLLRTQGFMLNEKDYDDVLALDYVNECQNFSGNIGMSYDEEKSNDGKLFSFYVLKAYDTNSKRFFKREMLPGLYLIGEIKKNFIEKFQDCISKYNSWNKDDLKEFIELPPMP